MKKKKLILNYRLIGSVGRCWDFFAKELIRDMLISIIKLKQRTL